MNGENQNPATPGASPQPQPSGQVPAPPQTPDVQLRTMESDVQSAQESGGEPKPEYIDLPSGGLTPATPAQTEIPVAPAATLPTPETPTPSPEAKPEAGPAAEPPKKSGFWLWLVIVIVIVIVGWLAYAYLWPLILGQTIEAPPEQPAAIVPLSPPPLAPSPHRSAFGSPVEKQIPLTITDYNLITILTAFQNEAAKTPPAGNVKELVVNNTAGPAVFSKLLAALVPELTSNGLEVALKNSFADDFTAFIYYDKDGVWPGLITNRRTMTERETTALLDQLRLLENSSYANIFLIPPGEAQGFRDGKIKEKYGYRYTEFSQPGASFNYGLFDRFLIITTSLAGLLGTIQTLGL